MGFELDEFLYKKVLKYFKNKRNNNAELLKKQVVLADIKPRLTLFARAICGEAIEIYPAEREGGYKNKNFFLPINCALFETYQENLKFYFFRILYLHQQRNLNFNWQANSANTTHQQALEKAYETAPIVLENLFKNFPAMQVVYNEMYAQLPLLKNTNTPDLSWLYGKWMKNADAEDEKDFLQNFNDKVYKNQPNLTPETTLKTKAVEEIESLMIDKKQQEDYVLMHSFEKIETAEEFNGNWRDFDGRDELEDHQEALEEMNMRFTVRVDDLTHSVYQADFVENTSVAESAEAEETGVCYEYDEWDFKKRKYLTQFCKVYTKNQKQTSPNYYKNTLIKYKATLSGLRKMLTSVNNKMQQQRKQLQGDSFDLDALTDLYTDIHSGKSPDERVYLSKRKQNKDLAILVLLDISLSSDGYAAGNRVIDVEKEVSILFGEILNEFQIDFAIDGFYSKTRNFNTYLTLKDFNENWNSAKNKIGAVEPNGYTRIGPALRHAGARLNKLDAKNKWIIVLSDGKPNDYDKYEGQYGINDVKQALRELNEQKINSYALAIEAQAKYYLPQMFGQNHYQILTSPNALIKAMVKLYEKIKHQ
ncbi:VWA domain-containing protein [Myroides sp. JBRI-B21084]|uniref:nitric oxide reductase activation protein NorD n=1 Tax=Myroides sp. JBRI-B21084 TaxID=3119977 RepID=UPI0026E43EB2|nr:VWA domain-containing protein [Paenimyroides cloacae]WKW46479.1 VWA domain-containing protein [Paenimyroides cloacae]